MSKKIQVQNKLMSYLGRPLVEITRAEDGKQDSRELSTSAIVIQALETMRTESFTIKDSELGYDILKKLRAVKFSEKKSEKDDKPQVVEIELDDDQYLWLKKQLERDLPIMWRYNAITILGALGLRE